MKVAELQALHFAIIDFEYNEKITMDELIQGSNTYLVSNMWHEMIEHLHHNVIIKLLEVYNDIRKSHSQPHGN